MKLKIENLSSGYDEDVVLRDLSLAVAEGEFLSLLGPSGCGKSTLMKTIAGILPARKGRIYLDGQEITNLPVHKRGTVVVFQDMRLFLHKSVAENVAFPLKMQGIPKQERLKTAEMLLEKVRMAGFGSTLPWLGLWRRSRSCFCWTNPSRPWMKISGRICVIWCCSCRRNSI